MIKHVIERGHAFKYAWAGIMYAVKTERNFQIQVVIGTLIFMLAVFLGVDQYGLSLLAFTSFLVLICEMINTAIEEVVDLATKEWKLKAKIAKDVAAGAALLSAMCAIIVGILVLYPYIFLPY